MCSLFLLPLRGIPLECPVLYHGHFIHHLLLSSQQATGGPEAEGDGARASGEVGTGREGAPGAARTDDGEGEAGKREDGEQAGGEREAGATGHRAADLGEREMQLHSW